MPSIDPGLQVVPTRQQFTIFRCQIPQNFIHRMPKFRFIYFGPGQCFFVDEVVKAGSDLQIAYGSALDHSSSPSCFLAVLTPARTTSENVQWVIRFFSRESNGKTKKPGIWFPQPELAIFKVGCSCDAIRKRYLAVFHAVNFSIGLGNRNDAICDGTTLLDVIYATLVQPNKDKRCISLKITAQCSCGT